MIKRAFTVLMLYLLPIQVIADDFVAGKDYVIISANAHDNKNDDPVLVTEFFSYGCPWCYRLESRLDQWIQSEGKAVYYNKIPVVFNKDWEYYAKAYYLVNALGLGKKLSPALFEAILKDKKKLNSEQSMVHFFKQHGVDEELTESAFNHSPSIDMELTMSKQQMAKFQIAAVPSLVINNHYKTDLQMAGTEERLFAILNFLISKSKHK